MGIQGPLVTLKRKTLLIKKKKKKVDHTVLKSKRSSCLKRGVEEIFLSFPGERKFSQKKTGHQQSGGVHQRTTVKKGERLVKGNLLKIASAIREGKKSQRQNWRDLEGRFWGGGGG